MMDGIGIDVSKQKLVLFDGSKEWVPTRPGWRNSRPGYRSDSPAASIPW